MVWIWICRVESFMGEGGKGAIFNNRYANLDLHSMVIELHEFRRQAIFYVWETIIAKTKVLSQHHEVGQSSNHKSRCSRILGFLTYVQ
jgi:hypothetical protein